ncbi:MAG: hypothetical protein CMF50_08945 [Legionellales bacterium]|nr:hypothetical protein [Legionellales bacterium]|tara:strand:- start:20755 stop:21165 length:411 start_codon:yes stop_codon:yes gene_type:complete
MLNWLHKLYIYLTIGDHIYLTLGVILCVFLFFISWSFKANERFQKTATAYMILFGMIAGVLMVVLGTRAVSEVGLEQYYYLARVAEFHPETRDVLARYLNHHRGGINGFDYAALRYRIRRYEKQSGHEHPALERYR